MFYSAVSYSGISLTEHIEERNDAWVNEILIIVSGRHNIRFFAAGANRS